MIRRRRARLDPGRYRGGPGEPRAGRSRPGIGGRNAGTRRGTRDTAYDHGAPPHDSGEDRCPAKSRLISRSGALPGSGDDANLLGLRALLALRDLEFHALAVFERLVAVHLDRGEVDEHVLPPVDRDEAGALLAVEPLHGALCHGALPRFDGARSPDLRSHLGTGAAARLPLPARTPGRTATEHARYTRRPRPAPPQFGQVAHQYPSRPYGRST